MNGGQYYTPDGQSRPGFARMLYSSFMCLANDFGGTIRIMRFLLHISITDPAFFPQRCAEIVCNNLVIGKIGVLHPNVLQKFEITNPCSYVEITIEPFV